MGWKENKRDYNRQYEKEVLKRIPLNVQKSEYEAIKAAADRAGQPVNTFIKDCIRARLSAEMLDNM
jgi:predicted HicB family RNase H-like nuclease